MLKIMVFVGVVSVLCSSIVFVHPDLANCIPASRDDGFWSGAPAVRVSVREV